MSIELNTDINVLLKLFNRKFSNNDIYMNVQEIINDFLDSEYYDDIIIEFNEWDYSIKESISQFINFDEKI